jgi:hypothetical protein
MWEIDIFEVIIFKIIMEGSKKKAVPVEDMGPENLPEDQQVGVSYIEFEAL